MTILKNKCVLLLISLLFFESANAFTLNGDLKGDTLRWRNGITQGEFLTTSYWQPISNLTPTSSWLPGLFRGATPDRITLTNKHGESVTVALSVDGIEYNLGPSSSLFDVKSKPSWVGYENCRTQQMGSIVRLLKSSSGGFCVSDMAFYSAGGTSSTPFSFLRPIIKLPDLVSAFTSAEVGEGTYRGGVMVSAIYGYLSPSGSVTYRNGLVPLDVEIKYSPSKLTSINVTGTGYIEPVYDKSALVASGSTRYTVTANGYFSNGLHMVFNNHSTDNDYYLEQIDGGARIPYSIECPDCVINNIVDAGSLKSKENNVLGKSVTSIVFELNISFENISAEEIETGNYIDMFTVMFEPNL